MWLPNMTAEASLQSHGGVGRSSGPVAVLAADLNVPPHRPSTIVAQDNCFWWGNWCGQGCSGPSPPIDDLDRCCKAHDECYGRGADRCACDRVLLVCVGPLTHGWTRKAWAATAIYSYFYAAQAAC
jgi:hypothetical protein